MPPAADTRVAAALMEATDAVMDHRLGFGGRPPGHGAWRRLACLGLVVAVGTLVLSTSPAEAQVQDALFLTADDTTAYPAVDVTLAVQPGRSLSPGATPAPDADSLDLVEDGTGRAVTVTPVTGDQLEVALLIDTSGDLVADAFSAQVAAAVELVLALPDGARVGVVTTGAPAVVASPLTEDVEAVLSVLSGLQPRPGVGAVLAGGVPLALAELAGTGAPVTAVVAFSGGMDRSGPAAVDAAVDELTGSGVSLYGVPLRGGGGALARLVSGSQGQLLETDDSLVGATDRIAAQLQNSYVLAYTSQGEGPTPIRVEADGTRFAGPATRTLALPAPPDDAAVATDLPEAPAPLPPVERGAVEPPEPEASNEPIPTIAVFLATAVGLIAVGALAVARVPVLTRPRTPRPPVAPREVPAPAPERPPADRPPAVRRLSSAPRQGRPTRTTPVARPQRRVTLPEFALLSLVLVEVTNAGTVLPSVGPLNAYILALGLATGALLLGLLRGQLRPEWSPLYLLAAVYFVTQLVSLPVSVDTGVGTADVLETMKDLVFLVVVTALVTMSRHQDHVARAAVLAVTLLAGLTIVNELLLDDPSAFAGFAKIPLPVQAGIPIARHSGPQADANFWARSLVLFIPLALSLWGAARDRARPRAHPTAGWGWLLAAGTLFGGVYLTQSRGALLSVVLMTVLWLLLAGRRYRRLLLLAPVALVVLLLVPGVGSRLMTLQGLGDARSAVGDYSLIERVALQQVGLSIVAAHPALGVGPGNFNTVFGEFSATSNVQPRAVDGSYAPHNLYLELLSEGGVVGLVGWLVLYGGALLLSVRAVVLTRPDGSEGTARLRWLALATTAGLIGWAIASVFLHLSHFRVLMVPLALVAVLDQQARGLARAEAPRAERALVLQAAPRRRRAGVAALATGCVVALVGALVIDLRPAAWSSEHSALVLPGEDASAGYEAYALDLLSRRPIILTFAAVMGSSRFQDEAADRLGLVREGGDDVSVGVQASTQSTAVTVTATSSDRQLAESMSRGVLESGRSYLNSRGRLYVLSAPASAQPAATPVRPIRWSAVAALFALATAVASIVFRVTSRDPGGGGR